MKQTLTINLAYAFFIGMIFSNPAYAYLDPGTGSILLQGLVAAVAGVIATGGIYWNKIKNFFSGNKEKHEQQTSEKK